MIRDIQTTFESPVEENFQFMKTMTIKGLKRKGVYDDEWYQNQLEEELALLIEEFLKQRILGMKNRVGVYVTQAFPKLLYVLEEDNIHKDSKYWYLTKLSAVCSAKRLVPDYISEKIMKEYMQMQ